MTKVFRLLSALTFGFLISGCTSAPKREPAQAPSPSTNEVACGQSQAAGQNFRYCLTRPAGGTRSKDVLYYLHGAGGTEVSWDQPIHHAMEDVWKKAGVDAPVVISISFGTAWFLSQEEGLFNTSLFDAFTEYAMKDVESRLGFRPARRLLMGESMGGFNSALLYFKAPKLFNRVALVCPAIFPFPPQVSDTDLNAYMTRHQTYIKRENVESWLARLKKAFSTADLWRDHDPLALVTGASSLSAPMFILSDEADQFGFNEGADLFRKLMTEKQAPVTFFSVPGATHCEQSPESEQALARWLVQ